MTRRSLTSILAVTAAFTASAGAYAATYLPDKEPPAVAAQRPYAPVQAVPAEQAAAFEVLRTAPPQARGRVVSLPDNAAQAIAKGPQPDLGANANLARNAGTDVAENDLYVVPASGWTCLTGADGISSCNTVEEALQGRLISLSTQPDGRLLLRGMLPDGARDVQVIDGALMLSVTPESNVYSVEVSPHVREIRFTDIAGVAHVVPLEGMPT